MTDEHDDRPIDLASVYGDRAPSTELEDRIAARYARSARMWTGSGRRQVWSVRIAASVVLFLAGYGAGSISHGGDAGEDAGARPPGSEAVAGRWYMLLLWQDSRFEGGPSDAAVAEEYARWARATAGTGIPLDGHELATERDLVRTAANPATDAEARIGGYFLVKVPDAAAARRLAEGHPHARRGGWIEVAEVLDAENE